METHPPFISPRSGDDQIPKLDSESFLKRALSFPRRFPGFTFVVVIPALLAILFFGFIQSNIYSSTAQFIVKDENPNSSLSGLGSFLLSAGISTPVNDNYTVNNYLTSRDALKSLEADPKIREIYARPEADFIDRFPNLVMSGSFENLFIHYNGWIKVDFDTTSNITTLTVNAFRPADAKILADRLLSISEAEINRLNDRVRNGALKSARAEVAQLQERALAIQDQITDFRNKETLLDPNQTSTQSVSLLSSLETDLVTARASLNQLQAAAPNSPQLPALRSRIAALQTQVAFEGKKGASGSDSLAPKIAIYQQLVLKQQIEQQMLQSAVTALEAAETTVQRQQLYLARVSGPNQPDRAQSIYDRLIDMAIALVTLLLIYGIGRLLSAAVGDYVLK